MPRSTARSQSARVCSTEFLRPCLPALADKVLGKAEKLGLIDASDTPAIPMDDESSLGKLLLAIVSSARAAGLEPERALREDTRKLQVEIRSFELDSDNDAGVIGSY